MAIVLVSTSADTRFLFYVTKRQKSILLTAHHLLLLNISKTLEEYQNYLKYKFVLDALLKIYNEKDKYKNGYEKQKKEIQKLEKKLVKTNSLLWLHIIES